MVLAMAAALAVAPSAHALAHAEFTASPQAGLIGTTFIFDAGGSSGERFLWDLDGDGTFETDTGPSKQATKSYTGAGPVTVGLKAIDETSEDTYTLQITVLAPTEPPPPEDDVTAPVISNAKITPTAFRLGPKTTPLNGHISRKARRGATLSWTLSEGANLSIKIQRCSSKKRCKPHVTVKMHRTVAAGTRSLAFSGRIELRKLGPGPYRFVLDATDLSDNFSKTVYVPFVILPG
jgi:hypothetical protein